MLKMSETFWLGLPTGTLPFSCKFYLWNTFQLCPMDSILLTPIQVALLFPLNYILSVSS